MEKGMSLRLGRSSSIRDIDITLPLDGGEERHCRLGRIQGRVWDQLYSPTSIAQVDSHVRSQLAEGLAEELRELIGKTRTEISVGPPLPPQFDHFRLTIIGPNPRFERDRSRQSTRCLFTS